jgi:hypothetical protein
VTTVPLFALQLAHRGTGLRQDPGNINTIIPNLLDNKEVFLHACATVAFALRAVADAVRTRTEKLPYYRVHSVWCGPENVNHSALNPKSSSRLIFVPARCKSPFLAGKAPDLTTQRDCQLLHLNCTCLRLDL